MDQLTPLGAAFHFTPQDLRVNRQGQVSPPQRSRLWKRFILTLLGGILLILAPTLITWILISWSARQSLPTTLTDDRAFIGYLIAVLLGLIYAAANFRTLLLCIDLLRGQVQPLVAPVRIWGEYLLIGQFRFVMEEETDLTLIKSGLTYRAFVLPMSQTLLSLEFAE